MTSPTLPAEPLPVAIAINARPARPFEARQVWLPLLLFVITLCSTTVVGMRYMHNFRLGLAPLNSDADILPVTWVWHNLHDAARGLPFSLTLILILLAHEFGHYFACRSYGVRSTLPYMLPAPSLSGTFGAVIRLKSRVQSRAALLVIGAAGPIAGFIVAVLAVVIGIGLSSYAPEPVMKNIQAPLLITAIQGLLHGLGDPSRSLRLIVPHPVLIASWIGILITALNHIPAGQLDGGHILYALSPRLHKISSRVVIAVLFLFGIFLWGGWLLWACILMLPGMRHPKLPASEALASWHYALIPLCAVILLLAATLQPFQGYSLSTVVHRIFTHTL